MKKYIPYIVILVLLFFWFQSCENHKAKINDLKTEASIDSLDFIQLNKTAAMQEIKIVSDRNTMKRLTTEVEGIKKVNKQLKLVIESKIKDVDFVPVDGVTVVHDTILIDSTKEIKHFLKLPQSYTFKNDWFQMAYSIDSSGVSRLDSALMTSKPIVSFGYKRRGFLKNLVSKPVAVVVYEDKNPYSKIKGFTTIEFKKKPKWYERKILWFGAGVVAGVAIIK